MRSTIPKNKKSKNQADPIFAHADVELTYCGTCVELTYCGTCTILVDQKVHVPYNSFHQFSVDIQCKALNFVAQPPLSPVISNLM